MGITRRRPSITSRRKRRPLRRLKGPRKSKLQRGNGRMSKSESAESAMRDGGPTAQLTQSVVHKLQGWRSPKGNLEAVWFHERWWTILVPEVVEPMLVAKAPHLNQTMHLSW